MQVPAEGLSKDHEKYINLGFAPWNIHKFFKYSDGTIVSLYGIYYGAGGRIKISFSSGDHLFVEDNELNLEKYEIM